jgi:hypothetical protein
VTGCPPIQGSAACPPNEQAASVDGAGVRCAAAVDSLQERAIIESFAMDLVKFQVALLAADPPDNVEVDALTHRMSAAEKSSAFGY